jgi:PTS system nitrogen regulatory IIA component
MRIVDLIRKDDILILPHLSATTKTDVIQELASFVTKHHEGLSEAEAARVLTEREQRGSTAVGDGLAIPHATHPALHDHVIACLGRSRKGIDFGSPDGKSTHFFFVIIAPENMSGSHLKALARISRLFKNGGLRARLADAKAAQEMYDILEEEDVD